MRWSRLAAAAARIRGDIPLVALDAFVVAATYFVLFVLRFDLSVPNRYWDRFGWPETCRHSGDTITCD